MYWGRLTQVLNVDTMTWQIAPLLPEEIRAFGSHVNFGETTLMIGGWAGYDDFLDDIYQWEPDTKTWFQREERIVRPREKMCSVMLSDSKVACT